MSQPAPQPPFQLPGPTLTVPQQEPHFPVSPREWRRLRAMVAEIANPIPWASGLMWTCVGIASSAFLAAIGWVAAYSQLPSTAQLQFAWIGPVMFVSSVAAVVIGALAFVVDLHIKREETRSVKHVLEYMDDMNEPLKAPTHVPSKGPAAPAGTPRTP